MKIYKMNSVEKIVYNYLIKKGFKKIEKQFKINPDFLVDDTFFVEVKSCGEKLSIKQIYNFSKINKIIYIYEVYNENKINITRFKKPTIAIKNNININIPLEDNLHSKLKVEAIKKNISMKDLIIQKLEAEK